MQNLNFDDGLKRLSINDDENRIITVNPTDMGIISRYKEMSAKLTELTEKYGDTRSDLSIDEIADVSSELDREARKIIDYIVGSDVSDIVFGKTNCLSCAGGQTIFENFLTAYMNYMTPVIKSEYEKSRKRVEKYTNQIK